MKIDTAIIGNNQYSNQRISFKNSMENTNDSVSFASILDTKIAQAASADSSNSEHSSQVDFTDMTRQEMFDWMNNQIRNGEMSLDESSPFLGMTVKISAATGVPVNMDTDSARNNFVEKAQMGINGALSRNDQSLAEKLQMAIEIMHKNQGIKFDADAIARGI